MFQNVGKSAFKKDLTNTLKLLEFLGNPHHDKKFIHVGGTNGKGSVSSILAASLTQSGYRTGLYTSPHLVSFTERIRIDGKEIEESFVISFVNRCKPIIEEIKPSFFELTVAMAFDYFAFQQVDIAVIEVGLGGRLDSTNVINPLLSVITSIGYDHMDLLGNTLGSIAFEKAGIFKMNTPAVIARNIPTEALEILTEEAKKRPCNYYLSKPCDSEYLNILSLKGAYQSQNLDTAYTCVGLLIEKDFDVSWEAFRTAITHVQELSGLRGRWELIQDSPPIICDTGHNSEAIPWIIEQLYQEYPRYPKKIIWGMVSDKDRSTIINMLPKDAEYFVVKPSVIRGLDASILAKDMKAIGLNAHGYSEFKLAVDAVIHSSDYLESVVFIGGSTFLVADAMVHYS